MPELYRCRTIQRSSSVQDGGGWLNVCDPKGDKNLGDHMLTRAAILRSVIVFALTLASLALSYTIVAVSPYPSDHGYGRGR
jgi:hypothetical protein